MSEKGTLSKSIANNISEAIIDKLGGSGYAPSEWKENINLLGIASEDSDFAIASLQEEASTSEKGALSLSIANDVGDILNKKYDTHRGFKMKETASAVSMLSPLPEKTASSAPICEIDDGADDVPTKSLVVTIPPTLSGVSSVTETQTGRNLLLPSNADISEITLNGIKRSYSLDNQEFTFEGTNTKTDSAWLIFNGSDWIIDGLKKGETYTFYHNLGASMYSQITYYDTNGALKALVNLAGSAGKNNTRTFTIPSDFDRVRSFQIGVYASATDINEEAVFMLCAGSSATTYEPYTAPTTHTASLGRTIYGGQADVVNGKGAEEYNKITLSSLLTDLNVTQIGTTGVYRIRFSLADAKGAVNSAVFNGLCDYYTPISANQTYNKNEGISINTSGQCYIYDSRFNTSTSLNDFKTWIDANPVNLCYELETKTDFTFTGQEVPTRLGYNAFWADEGDTEVVYRAIQTPYERGTLTGGIVNFDDADTNFPLVKLEADLAPTLDGKSAVEFTRCGKNLFDKSAVTPNTWIIVNSTETETTIGYFTSDYIPVKANTRYYVSTKGSDRTAYYDKNKNGIAYFSFSGGASFNSLYDGYIRLTIKNDADIEAFVVNEGNEAITYEPYNGTTFTASFGRAIYGGSADIVKGEGTVTHGNTSLSDKNYYYSSNLQRFDCALDGVISSGYADDFIPPQGYTISHLLIQNAINAPDMTMCIYGGKLYIKNLSCSSVEELVNDMNDKYITYPLATPTDFTFDAQRVEALPGVNNFYNDIGDTDVEYIKTR